MGTTLAFLAFSLSTLVSVNVAYSSSFALELQNVQPSRSQSLRKCTSLSTDLSQATSLDELMTLPKSTPSTYIQPSSTHQKLQDQQLHKRPSRAQRPQLSSGEAEIMVAGKKQRRYTRLQTQLYPDMTF
jgi:hypothetical protein